MIRINLLPVRQVKKVQAGQRQLLILLLLFAAEFVVMFFIYENKASEVEQKQRALGQLQGEIDQLKKTVGDFDQLKAQRDRLLAQRDIINQLQRGRTGPVWVMREVSEILTTGRGPQVDQARYEALLKANPSAGFNPRWNPNRLWVEGYGEVGPNRVRISGKAKDYDDVAEFNKRITLSRYFADVFLERNDQIMDGGLHLKVVRFSLTARVVY